ncbi:aspartic-type endopeptidase ctsD [Gigaspora margarita]|uniref:Aspartic-type endopeptidase ctsD n=1 Tax=Gigaspora margarita TaxID=4874 RepID=A0A8H3WYJ9_GIGMA|nr:aspartic-type endopeptidase ctsD [Gigaspora margarita]
MTTLRIFVLLTLTLILLLDGYANAEQGYDSESTTVILTKQKPTYGNTLKNFINVNNAYLNQKYSRLKKRQSPSSNINLSDELLVTGSQGHDTVIFGGVTITNQTFGLAANMPSIFASQVEDGILGLAAVNSRGSKVNGVMQSIKEQKQLSKNIIGFHFAREKNNSKDISFMTLGDVNQDAMIGSIGYNAANVSTGHWVIPLKDLKVDGSSLKLSFPEPAIIDTGSSIIYGLPQIVDLIHSRIPSAAALSDGQQVLWTIPCNTKSIVSLTFDSGSYPIDPSELVVYINQSHSLCLSGIQYSPFNFWLIGDVFLTSVYSVFDFDNYAVGFAESKIMANSHTSNTAINSFQTQNFALIIGITIILLFV